MITMRKLLLTISLILCAASVNAEKFFVAIQLDMQIGTGLYLDDSARRVRNNNVERAMQYLFGKKFDTLKECEIYMMDDKRKSAVTEHYADYAGMGFVWNNYASDSKTIVQQWRCLELYVLD